MKSFFLKLFNLDRLADLNARLEIYRVRNAELEEEVKVNAGYRLKYKIAQMLVDDDPAIDELLECYKKKEADDLGEYQRRMMFADSRAQSAAFGQLGMASGMASGLATGMQYRGGLLG